MPPWVTSIRQGLSNQDRVQPHYEGPGAGTGSCGLVQIEAVGVPSLLPETTDLVVRKRDKTDQTRDTDIRDSQRERERKTDTDICRD
jgi:hypothetical protein